METQLVIVRHGETIWNLQHRQQGHKDSPLTDLGQKQALALAQALKGETYTAIYSSDLGRAMKTAAAIAGALHMKTSADARLRERNLGIMEGLTLEELRNRDPNVYRNWLSGNPDYRIPEGESEPDLRNRCLAAFGDLALRHPNSRILVITHSGALQSLFLHTMGLPSGCSRSFSLYNASINNFRYCDGRWYMETWGNITHLLGLGAIDYK